MDDPRGVTEGVACAEDGWEEKMVLSILIRDPN